VKQWRLQGLLNLDARLSFLLRNPLVSWDGTGARWHHAIASQDR
jgi:hypothetical protein